MRWFENMKGTSVIPHGEVVFTSTTEIIGQCASLDAPFAYGSFVAAGKSNPCIGVVYNLETTSIDPGRRPAAIGVSEEDLPRLYPQLAGLLRCQFHALLIGRFSSDGFRYGLPGTPPALHSQVIACSSKQLQQIGQDLNFLRLIYASGKIAMEELLLSACRHLFESLTPDSPSARRLEMVRMGKALCELYRDDYDSLRRMMGRVETWPI